ncbi:hypothetical protein [Streptomyces youssoufiensis]
MATHPALAYLHEVRAGARRAKRRNAWFAAYACALIGGAWGLPLLLAASRAGGDGGRGGALGARVLDALPLLAPAALLLALLLIGYGATWRGPVTVERPALTWLLSAPLARAPVVLPRLLAALGLAAAGGAVAGGVAGFLLAALRGGPWAGATTAGGWAGLCTALVGGALGVAVERHEPSLLRRGPGVLRATRAAIAALCAGGALGAMCGVPSWLGAVCLWSGPWGWAAQPLVAAVGGPAPGWRVAAALAAGCAALAVWSARRAAPLIPLAALRRRATVAAQVTAALFALDLRQARGAVRTLETPGARPRLRLPPPRHRWLLIPWRDATGLLRSPAHLAWAALWTTVAVALTAYAPTARGGAQLVAVAGAAVAGYLAAAQLAEPARVEADDIRRAAPLPTTAGALALWHACVPGAALLTGTGAGALLCALAGRWQPGLALLVAAVPAYVAAALVSAYRGPVPPHVLIGVETPMGNTGGPQAVAWYLRGPLVLLGATIPVLVATARASGFTPLAFALALLWLWGAGAAGLWWAWRTGRRVLRG